MKKHIRNIIENEKIKLRRINLAIKQKIRTEYNKGRRFEIEINIRRLEMLL
jgi:hypothetical protein